MGFLRFSGFSGFSGVLVFLGFSGGIGGWGKKIVTYVLENDNAIFHFIFVYWFRLLLLWTNKQKMDLQTCITLTFEAIAFTSGGMQT